MDHWSFAVAKDCYWAQERYGTGKGSCEAQQRMHTHTFPSSCFRLRLLRVCRLQLT